jgi:hypothetical protein
VWGGGGKVLKGGGRCIGLGGGVVIGSGRACIDASGVLREVPDTKGCVRLCLCT